MSMRLQFPGSSRILVAAFVLGVIVIGPEAGAQVKQAGAPKLNASLAKVRAGLDKYRDPMVAVRDGFLSTVSCMDFPNGATDGSMTYKSGAMGVHFVNMGNV